MSLLLHIARPVRYESKKNDPEKYAVTVQRLIKQHTA